jgi:hypothetical protein
MYLNIPLNEDDVAPVMKEILVVVSSTGATSSSFGGMFKYMSA